MVNNLIKSTLVLILLVGCKSFNLEQPSQTKTGHQVILGSIGESKDFLLQSGFNNSAVPSYKTPIKLSVITKPFNNKNYKAYLKTKGLQSANVQINFVDSIAIKPTYIQLQIADKVELIKALNNSENNAISDYLSLNNKAEVINKISIALNTKTLEAIKKADAVFLSEYGTKTYAIKLYENKVNSKTILFNEGVIFEYSTLNCCWQENNKHQIVVADLVSKNSACPKSTYRTSNHAKKNINYYKL